MNEPNITISAIIISFNGIDFLPDCLRTLKEDLQDLSHEIIVVDNGSVDGSVEFIKENHPDVILIENGKNLGFAKAVNIGLRKARGDYLYVLNQDLRFDKGTIGQLLARLKKDEKIGMIGPKYIGFDGKLQKSIRAFPKSKHIFYRALFLDRMFKKSREFGSWRMTWFNHEEERVVDQPMGSVMLIPRTVLEKVGEMDEKFPIFFNDVDLCRRIHDTGYKCLYYPEAVVEHFVGGSMKKQPVKMRFISSLGLIRYLHKYEPKYKYPIVWSASAVLMLGMIPLIVIAAFKSREVKP